MKKMLIILLIVLPFSFTVKAQAGSWLKIEPGGDTGCAYGDAYAYWVHLGTRNDLLIFFQGGGGCWNADTCRDNGREFNGFFVNSITENDHPHNYSGLLNLSHPENPFADYTVLYIPVCTGDVHWGKSVTTFDEVTVNFNGFVNASTALEWAYENIPDPDSIFITGCSAGSPGSLLHTPYVIDHYPKSRVAQFGDSLSLIGEGPLDLHSIWKAHDNFPDWIPALTAIQPSEWTMAKHYIATANYYPDYTFSQFNTRRDEVQVFYTYPNGDGDPYRWAELLDAHLAEVQANAPNYRSFTAGGDLHCITPRDLFYEYAIDGMKLRDWVADIAQGRDVPNLHCGDCEVAERE